MVIEFDKNSYLVNSTELINKYYAATNNICIETWILIDPNWIKTIYLKKECKDKYLNFWNMKYIKIDSYNLSTKSQLVSHINSQKKNMLPPIEIDVQFLVTPKTSMNDFQNNLEAFDKCLVQNIKINFIEKLEQEKISSIVHSIFKIRRLNHIHIYIENSEILEWIMEELLHLNSTQKLTIEWDIDLKWYDLIEFRSKFRNGVYKYNKIALSDLF